MNLDRIILGPILTEKGAYLTESQNKYFFEVGKGANKIEIRKAIESKFGVKVNKVAVINNKGKSKSMSVKSSGKTIRTQGKRAGMKKAIVTLKEGNEIDLTNMEF